MSAQIRRIQVVGREMTATRTVLDGLSAFETERVASVAGLAQRQEGPVVLVAPALTRDIEHAVAAVRRIDGAKTVVIAADEVSDVSVDAVVPIDAETIARRMEVVLEKMATERARRRTRRLEGLAGADETDHGSASNASGEGVCRRLVESGLFDSAWVLESDGGVAVPSAAAGIPISALGTFETGDWPWTRAMREGTAVIDDDGVSTVAVPFDGGCVVGVTTDRIDGAEIEPLSRLAEELGASGPAGRPPYALLGEAITHEINNHLDLATVHLELADGDAEHLDHVEAALERIEAVTEEVGALVSRSVDIQPCSLEAIATDVWESASTSDATLRGNDATIEADEDLLRLLLSNLFRNAVQHGGDAVTVEVGPLDDGGFYVADDGAGFPDIDPGALFEWGKSGGNSTGIGLALVELAAERHGWEVDATDSDGARFEFRVD
ncbi:sensor histidine kinase [Natronomonas amylolytica]|uniref:sensor histidine kinase n=1 Tax=Natronomonas amylolytica TaxID=3108498 RepID=UPI003009AE09